MDGTVKAGRSSRATFIQLPRARRRSAFQNTTDDLAREAVGFNGLFGRSRRSAPFRYLPP
jgi:hypothetical protein